MRAFPPSAPDRPTSGGSPRSGCSSRPRRTRTARRTWPRALTAGAEQRKQQLETTLKQAGSRRSSTAGRSRFHMFDYNLDHLGPGTIDDPAWKMQRPRDQLPGPGAGRPRRPVGQPRVRGGLPDDLHRRRRRTARRPRPLHPRGSTRTRRSTPSGPSPCTTCPTSSCVANPIDRYSIGDRTPGLRRAADGSLTIVIQHEPAGRHQQLAARPGRTVPAHHAPVPATARVLDGSYQIPPITKAASAGTGPGISLRLPLDSSARA